ENRFHALFKFRRMRGATLDLPKELAERADLPLLSHNLPADFAALRKLMMNHQ
ncbi:hypothetical protein ACUOA5_18965, partial [Escherichia coli]